MDTDHLREALEQRGLRRADLVDDPVDQFRDWYAAALEAGAVAADAMVVATVDSTGLPDARTVLLKGVDGAGFVFYTNLGSPKANQLSAHPHAALVFTWHELRRQVRVRGGVEAVSPDQADAYWAVRPRNSRLGAWASPQSEVISDRAALDAAAAAAAARFEGAAVHRPQWWSGFRVHPVEVEFWQGRPDRLHDRFRYRREGEGWRIDRLAP